MSSDPVDPTPEIRESCKKQQCMSLVAEYEACANRVAAKGDGNCIGQFGDLLKCIDKCAAPKIFATLK
ncbi:mitochondrial Complex III (CIII) ubiquinol:cytochrome c oxidoreductase Qcr6 [Andalucia godoyi]|uniref:Cytochrome b-c1 complex subunit 6 n=1 Tax=Andalucia godoyi TaxID=505711 RepID=A0A8K0AJY7_ANDGO|nr:mitochondrial Complex III (CIII) ubiquinol:cytochrome c oxidoreductase Qcr6 [Andalucia godoyi]|eukprot:ANDGO_03608.mRNA.1 mitochondrial Complex III (CIII) ubiquinol:cytochrome c oxidoreductase Qcr6